MKNRRLDAATQKRLLVGVLLVLALVFLLSAMRYLRPAAHTELPTLGLMTSLPLQSSEGGVEAAVNANAPPQPVYARLSAVYKLSSVETVDDLKGLSVVLLAQPRAIPNSDLVKLDTWVRNGGHLLLLADPALQWGSLYPIGDKRRPVFTSMLSPLFSHWGIELVLPIGNAEPVSVRQIDGLTILTRTPGEWRAKASGTAGDCDIGSDALYAECAIGKGRAILIADADLLDTRHWQGQGARLLTGSDEYGNVRWIEAKLAALQAREFMGK